MKRLLTLLCLCMLLIPVASFAQNRITGTVTDTRDNPIVGATILIKNTAKGASSDADGNFVLNDVPASGTLVVSLMGYGTREFTLGTATYFPVVLEEEAENLDEVVVVGYGTQKKSDLTGAVAQIKSDDLLVTSASNPIQALQGRVAGVAVLSNSKPGSAPNMRIRGSGSINANNEPLYVVDGFPLMSSDIGDLNSNDIASVEILKDASSSAIYGSRGANGVVIITTKKGSRGKNELSVSSYVGIQTPARLVETIDRDEFIRFMNEAYTFSRGRPVYTDASPAPNYNTDWQKEIIRSSSVVQDYSFSFDGGKDQTSYVLSGGYFSQDGLIPTSGYEKYNARLALNHAFKPWLTVGSNMQFTYSKQHVYDNATGDIFRFGWPTIPVKNPDGSWYIPILDPQHSSYFEGAAFNPVCDFDATTNTVTRNRFLGDVYAEVKLHKNLTFRTNFGLDLINSKSYDYTTSKSTGALTGDGKGKGGQGYTKAMSKLTENILTYSNVWDVHRLTATGVYSYQDYKYETLSISGSGFENDATGAHDMNLANRASVNYKSDKYSNKLISFTGRLAYAYDDKYLLTVTGRYDGSSRFGENNKWGFFPSVGLGWRASEEEFLKNNKVITNLKLRASYGQTGNQEIDNYGSLAKMTSINYVFGNSYLNGFKEKNR